MMYQSLNVLKTTKIALQTLISMMKHRGPFCKQHDSRKTKHVHWSGLVSGERLRLLFSTDPPIGSYFLLPCIFCSLTSFSLLIHFLCIVIFISCMLLMSLLFFK